MVPKGHMVVLSPAREQGLDFTKRKIEVWERKTKGQRPVTLKGWEQGPGAWSPERGRAWA